MAIKVCVPYYLTVCKCTILSLYEFKSDGLDVEVQFAHGPVSAMSRNALINNQESSQIYQKLTDRYSHYLLLNNDVGMHPAQLQRLIDDDKPVVSAAYPFYQNDKCFAAGFWQKAQGKSVEGALGELVSRQSYGLNKVDWVGAGALLIQRQVLEKTEYPWFRHEIIRGFERVQTSVGEEIVRHQQLATEEASFCLNCSRHKIDVWLDCDCLAEYIPHAQPDGLSQIAKQINLGPPIPKTDGDYVPGVSGAPGPVFGDTV